MCKLQNENSKKDNEKLVSLTSQPARRSDTFVPSNLCNAIPIPVKVIHFLCPDAPPAATPTDIFYSCFRLLMRFWSVIWRNSGRGKTTEKWTASELSNSVSRCFSAPVWGMGMEFKFCFFNRTDSSAVWMPDCRIVSCRAVGWGIGRNVSLFVVGWILWLIGRFLFVYYLYFCLCFLILYYSCFSDVFYCVFSSCSL